MSQVSGYKERLLEQSGRARRWGVYNHDADRFLDVHFSSEAEARQAAGFLTKVRVR